MECKTMIEQISTRISNFIGHRACFLCHQSSRELVCKCCLMKTVLPLFPVPGHNLLEYPIIAENLNIPAYESLIVLGKYEGVLKGLINQLKFSRQTVAADVLVALFCQYLQAGLSMKQHIPDALVPIPLSSVRHINRQFNQSRLLSQVLAKRFGIKSYDLLKRTRHTKQQSRLNKEDRLQNIHNAFTAITDFEFESIAIVDDVITTGATANAACLAIQEAYPNAQVNIWCMAAAMR